jgi:hypothetical protein
MKWPISRRIWVVGGIAIGVIAAAGNLSTVRHTQDKTKVNNMTQKMMTVCVGRFTIDLPEGAEVEFTPARIAGVNIKVQSGYTEQQLQSEVNVLEAALALKKNEYDRPSLEKKLAVDAINFKSSLMYYGREKPVALMEYGKRVPGTEEGISIAAFGMKDSVSYRFTGERLASPRSENNVLKLVKNFEALTPGQTPTNPGFCIEKGLVRDPLVADDNESVTMFASLKGHPDIAIRLDTSINMKRIEDSLLSRDSDNETKREYASHFKSLGKGPRTINAIPGEEVLDKVKDLNGTSAHAFMWEGPGKMNDVLAPTITLELQTGKGRPGQPINSSLSDDEVLQLWERVSSSLKIRATSEAKGGQAAATANAALGELVATGRACPQTGFWECKESENVAGGSRKFFREGENMPPATLNAAPSLWGKLSGAPSSAQVSTVWKLVDYEALPDEDVVASKPVAGGGGALIERPKVGDPESGLA